jgi:Macrocin-O-methyltransferase (TylF).
VLSDGQILDRGLQGRVDQAIATVRPFTMLSRDRLSILFELVQHVHRCAIPGAFAECGVWKGGAGGMMAYACRVVDETRDLHLFDAFSDICEPDHRIDGDCAVHEAGGSNTLRGAS